ncbi:IclR family transcriptional regulator [Dehalobacter sp. DCM]|uniref:IclR family transcriptional regulator n=1 Tax=Dehalobacter sp. DCM TaxID=2907827 RepID=UPI0030820BE8|nr:IclR family transcriptional regulator [Dehalobacter sp. DCM]
MEGKSGHVNSIEKAFILLDCFLNNNEPLSLKELTERTGWPKSTIHSLLSAMRRQEIIVQNADGKYAMGIHVFQLGSAMVRALDIVKIAKPLMKEVADSVNRSVHLTTLRANHAVIIARVEPVNNRLKTIVAVGSSMPLYCNAHGKVYLSCMLDNAVKEYVRTTELIPYTSKTIIDYDALFEEITAIRKQGYALERDERHMGMFGVAAPIFDAMGKVVYAFGVVGMFDNMSTSDLQSAIALVKKIAHIISYQLGYNDKRNQSDRNAK